MKGSKSMSRRGGTAMKGSKSTGGVQHGNIGSGGKPAKSNATAKKGGKS